MVSYMHWLCMCFAFGPKVYRGCKGGGSKILRGKACYTFLKRGKDGYEGENIRRNISRLKEREGMRGKEGEEREERGRDRK